MANVPMKSVTLPGLPDKYTFAQIDNTLTQTGQAADAKKTGDELNQLKADFTQLDETAARIDGSYDTMTVGNAKQLTSNVGINDKAPYLHRTAGGANDIGDREYVNAIVGGSVIWNQLANLESITSCGAGAGTPVVSGTTVSTTITGTSGYRGLNLQTKTVEGHKYLFSVVASNTLGTDNVGALRHGQNSGTYSNVNVLNGSRTEAIISATGSNLYIVCWPNNTGEYTLSLDKLMVIDLTLMFGVTIADYVYSLETSTAGAGVAWLKKYLPLDSYIPYCEPTIKSVSGLVSHNMTGFNQWDEEWEVGDIYTTSGTNKSASDVIRCKNYIPVIPGVTYYFKSPTVAVKYYYDKNKNYLGSSNWNPTNTTITFPNNVRYIRFRMNSSYGTTYKNDICLNIHWDGERDGEYEAYKEYNYPLDSDVVLRGIPKLDANNNLYYDGDTYEADGTVTRKYGFVDLGTLSNYVANGLNNVYVNIPGKKVGSDNVKSDQLEKRTQDETASSMTDDSFKTYSRNDGISIRKDGITINNAAQMLSGVYLLYELATPTTETADPYQTPQVVDDWGTEEYVYTDGAFPIPVGHDTFYAANLKAKLEMAPDSPGDGDGDYIVRQTNGLNEYVKMVKELPSTPTTDGSYHLEVTVASGTPTLTWVADE